MRVTVWTVVQTGAPRIAGWGAMKRIPGLARSEAAFIAVVVTALVLSTAGGSWLHEAAPPLVLLTIFAWLFAVMLWGSFSAVHHADWLAETLGEPFGTLILTFSVIIIEISVIAAVMLHAGPNPTLPRDTMLAVIIIVLDGVVGLALLLGGMRHREQTYNLQGARDYLCVLMTLATISLILPRFTTSTAGPTLTVGQSLAFAIATGCLYATFLAMQTVRHRDHFADFSSDDQVREGPSEVEAASDGTKGRLAFHAAMLVLMLLFLVMLSKKLAVVVDYGTGELGLPEALGGMIVAILVLAPEALAALKAAAANHLQRAVNICLGSALATISLTVPSVVLIGIFSGLDIQLGLDPSEMVLLLLTLSISVLTFGAVRTNMLQGAVHLVVFFVYVVLVLQP
jgi:Ca2+:H+ antiporter